MGGIPSRFLQPRWLLIAVATLGCAATVGFLSGPRSDEAFATGPRPNILVIVTDDQRMHTVGSGLPSSPAWMPKTINWFRSGWDPDGIPNSGDEIPGGTSFQWAFVTTPNCCPSRASILTGQYSHNHNVRENSAGEVHNFNQDTSLERYLQNGGYWTGIFGKFFNGWVKQSRLNPSDPNLGNPKYFNRWAIFDGGYISQGQLTGCSDEAGEICVNDQGNYKDLSELSANYTTTFVGDRAVDFINEASADPNKQPWFLYVAPYAPHLPATYESRFASLSPPPYDTNPALDPYISPFPSRSDRGIYPADVSGKPQHIQDVKNVQAPGFLASPPTNWPQSQDQGAEIGSVSDCSSVSQNGLQGWKECIAKFRTNQYRALKSVDDQVDRIFSALGTQANNTLAFFISDNGFLWGEFWLSGKYEPYTDSVRVPLLMRWPAGGVQQDFVDTRLVANIDIAPTAMAAAQVTPPLGSPPMDGRNLLDPSARTRLLLERIVAGAQAQTRVWGALRAAPSSDPRYYYIARFAGGDIDSTPPPPLPAPPPPSPLPPEWTPTFQEHYDLTTSPLYLLSNTYSAPGELVPQQGMPPPDSTPPANQLAQGVANYLNCAGPESPILPVTQFPQTATPGCP